MPCRGRIRSPPPASRLSTARHRRGPLPSRRRWQEQWNGQRVVWLPGKAHAPLPLTRTHTGRRCAPAMSRQAARLWPFEVTALSVSPSAALDVALALRLVASPELHPGASVSPFSALAALALEIVAAGRVLPNLQVRSRRGYEARLGAPDERGRRRTRADRDPFAALRSAAHSPPRAFPQKGSSTTPWTRSSTLCAETRWPVPGALDPRCPVRGPTTRRRRRSRG